LGLGTAGTFLVGTFATLALGTLGALPEGTFGTLALESIWETWEPCKREPLQLRCWKPSEPAVETFRTIWHWKPFGANGAKTGFAEKQKLHDQYGTNVQIGGQYLAGLAKKTTTRCGSLSLAVPDSIARSDMKSTGLYCGHFC